MTHEKALEMLKPCPFCGNTDLVLSEQANYEEQVKEHGSACISANCKKCKVDMYEHTYEFSEYGDRLVLLIQKWNRRERNAG